MDKSISWTGTHHRGTIEIHQNLTMDRHNEYLKPVELAEDVRDLADAKKATLELASGEDEAIPVEIVNRLMAGNDHPLKIWREYRQLTQDVLGTTAGVGKSYISQIESGSKFGSARVLKALTEILQVDVGDLIAD